MKTLKFIAAVVLLAVSNVASAKLITVTVTGDGVLRDEVNSTTEYMDSSLSFTYDESLFTLKEEKNFTTGTGKIFSTPDVELDVVAGGTQYNVSPLTGAEIFDQPDKNDQFSFRYGGNVLMQWNDITSSAFSDPLPLDFGEVSDLLIDQVINNPNLKLSNNAVHLRGLNGNNRLILDIKNANVSFTIKDGAEVPEPAAVFLFGFGLLGLAGFQVRRK